jgi:hypothetical protein
VDAQQQSADRTVNDSIKEMADSDGGDCDQEQETGWVAAQRVGARAVFQVCSYGEFYYCSIDGLFG